MQMTGLTGSRVRERRLALGMRQADLARGAAISASYLNLIEHNRRRVSADMLVRLAAVLSVEPEALSEGVEQSRMQDLRVAAASAPAGLQPELDRIEDFWGRFPGWAELLLGQYRRLGQLEQTVAALNDRISHDPHLSLALHELLSAVSSIRSTSAILAETEDIEASWRIRFHGNLNADSERLAVGAEALVAYLDGSDQPQDAMIFAPQEELESWLAARNWTLPELEVAGGAAALAPQIAALASAAARRLATDWVAQAAQDAAHLPLEAFYAARAALGGDPLRIARALRVDVLTVFRRLAFLPNAPEGLVICDGSGTLLMRKPIEGFALPRFGAACALWPLYTALSRPMAPVATIAELPGMAVQRYQIKAFCAPDFPQGFGGIEVRQAAMLIAPAPPGPEPALLIGTSCRICPRAGCVARREPSIMTEFT
jgi:transcriptional regulator with XRE-family HTH domain